MRLIFSFDSVLTHFTSLSTPLPPSLSNSAGHPESFQGDQLSLFLPKRLTAGVWQRPLPATALGPPASQSQSQN